MNRTTLALVALAAVLAPVTASAHGDGWRHRGPPPGYYGPPPRYYAPPPPPVFYAPPPRYYAPPPRPLHFYEPPSQRYGSAPYFDPYAYGRRY